MKNLFSFAILVLISTNLFGQNVTNMNFTGMLAKTTFAQFSLNATNNTIATAGSSYITAIAAPTVDVANITDMALTISSGSTLVTAQSTTGAPISTTTVPTNYTGSEQPLSGFVFSPTNYAAVYAGNTAGDRYRGINIFIHKLTPAPLPLIVSTSNAGVQPGFAQCSELVNGGSNPQLHTNGQSIYLAFTSAADVVKFQYENVGTATADPDAAIIVEKSADLVTWTTIQSIDISNQIVSVAGSGKVNVAAEVNDATARYIRIRIDGLANSRSNRKETIRNISVLTKPVITWNQDLTKFTTADIGGTETVLTATSSSSVDINSAPITYTSSDANVAYVVDNKLFVLGEGTAVITAKQSANNYYLAADDVPQTVTVTNSLGKSSFEKEKEINFIFVTREGIVSNIEGTLQVYAINGVLLKNIAVSKNQVIPVAKGEYIVRTTINGKSISKIIVK